MTEFETAPSIRLSVLHSVLLVVNHGIQLIS